MRKWNKCGHDGTHGYSYKSSDACHDGGGASGCGWFENADDNYKRK